MELTPKQTQAMTSPAQEIMYGGAAGGGKSFLIRMVALTYFDKVPGIQIYLFRRLSKDLMTNHLYGESGFLSLLAQPINAGRVKVNEQKGVIRDTRTGAMIHLCHCQYEKDKFSYDGDEMHVLLFDELTHFSESIYRFLRGRVRVSKNLKTNLALPRIISGTNPGNIGHNWVRRCFVRGCRPLEIRKMPPAEGGFTRQFIPAFLEDNPHLNQEQYAATLSGLGNPTLVRAKLRGDWDIVSGGMFDDLWNVTTQDRIVLPAFKIPKEWTVTRAFDWGSSKPFSVGWWAQTNGEDVTLRDGRKLSLHAGSLVRVHEWYGCKPGESNVGLKIQPREIAKGIREREHFMSFKVKPGPADSSIFSTERGDSIADEMFEAPNKIRWLPADKSPGSRINGAALMRARLAASIERPMEAPGLFTFDHCRNFIDLIPIMPRDEKKTDDVDTEAEDHIYDETRYRVLQPDYKGSVGTATAH